MDSYEDLAGSLWHTRGEEGGLLGKEGGDSRLRRTRPSNESVVVNARPSGEFYEVMGGKGILRRP